MDVRFENLNYLHLLWVVALLVLVVLYGFSRKRRALERFASAHLLPHLVPHLSVSRRRAKAALLLSAMVLLVLGMTDPRWGVHFEDVQRRGIDIMFVLDVSRSMLAADIAPNRLGRAKQYIGDTLEVLGGDRVGLVTFAGNAVLTCPLTVNYGSFRMALDEVSTRSSTRGGSLLGDAIRMAAESFVDKIKEHKVIIVLSDGEDQESYPVEAAKKAHDDLGIKVFTVGLGDSKEGARIPVEQNGQKLYLKYQGQEVWSKMSPTVLTQVAESGGGAYIPAGTSNIDLGQIYTDRIAGTDQREFEVNRIQQYNVQFQWFAGAALVLLLIEAFMKDRKPEAVEAVRIP